MKSNLLFISLLITALVTAMENPSGSQQSALTIIGQRTGNIDTSCKTTADLMHNGSSLARISYTLNGGAKISHANLAMGPCAYQNETFLARITQFTISAAESSSCALLAFAIKNLQELHEKQNKEGIRNHTLYIDSLVNPGSYESFILEFFGFTKVDNYYANGCEQHVYLLDPSAEGQARSNAKFQRFFLPASSITAEQTYQEPETKDNPYKRLLAEINARNRAAEVSQAAKTHSDSTSSEDAEIALAKPAPAAASQEELRKTALAKLRATPGRKARLPRAELVAMMHPKTGLAPIKGISKTTSKKP